MQNVGKTGSNGRPNRVIRSTDSLTVQEPAFIGRPKLKYRSTENRQALFWLARVHTRSTVHLSSGRPKIDRHFLPAPRMFPVDRIPDSGRPKIDSNFCPASDVCPVDRILDSGRPKTDRHFCWVNQHTSGRPKHPVRSTVRLFFCPNTLNTYSR